MANDITDEFQRNINTLTPTNISLVLLGIPKELSNVIKLKAKATKSYNIAKRNAETQYAKSFDEIKWNTKKRYANKGEIEIQVMQNKRYLELIAIADDFKAQTEYWDDKMTFIKQTGYALKEYIEYQKFLAGEK